MLMPAKIHGADSWSSTVCGYTSPVLVLLQVLTHSHLPLQQQHLAASSYHLQPNGCLQQQRSHQQQQLGASSCSSSSSGVTSSWHQQEQQQQHRGSRSSVCTHASAASQPFQGPDGSFSAGEQSSFLSAFWRFLRPHTIRGTILGTSAVVTKVRDV